MFPRNLSSFFATKHRMAGFIEYPADGQATERLYDKREKNSGVGK